MPEDKIDLNIENYTLYQIDYITENTDAIDMGGEIYFTNPLGHFSINLPFKELELAILNNDSSKNDYSDLENIIWKIKEKFAHRKLLLMNSKICLHQGLSDAEIRGYFALVDLSIIEKDLVLINSALIVSAIKENGKRKLHFIVKLSLNESNDFIDNIIKPTSFSRFFPLNPSVFTKISFFKYITINC